MDPIIRSVLVFMPCPSTVPAKYFFPDVAELRAGVEVVGIEAYDGFELYGTPDGDTIPGNTNSTSIYVTLVSAATERYKDMPYTTLIARLNGGCIKVMEPVVLNFKKSFVRFPIGSVNPGPVAFTVYFRKRP